jgi:transcriptional regulator with XRE-family HTH domain
MSQLQLAEQAEVSTRHISFVETGKSSPSREMVLVLSSALDVPLRERNALLGVAGFAPVYRETDLDEPAMTQVRRALEFILERQEPFPAVVVDRTWNTVMLNRAAQRTLGPLVVEPAALGEHLRNALHLVFHPKGLRPRIINWEEVAGETIARLHREVHEAGDDDGARRLLEALLSYPGVPRRWWRPDLEQTPRVLIPIRLRTDEGEVGMFTTVTSLGTPRDVTAQELRIESYFPADAGSEAWMRSVGNAGQA